MTQPGLPRAYYGAHGRVGDLVVEAQHAVSQVAFSGLPSGHIPTSAPISQPPPPTSQDPPVQSPFLPTPSLGSELTLGVGTYNPPPGPPPGPPPAVCSMSMSPCCCLEAGIHLCCRHATRVGICTLTYTSCYRIGVSRSTSSGYMRHRRTLPPSFRRCLRAGNTIPAKCRRRWVPHSRSLSLCRTIAGRGGPRRTNR